jgi:hypothetical protein
MTRLTESEWTSGTPCDQHSQEWCTYCRPRDPAAKSSTPPAARRPPVAAGSRRDSRTRATASVSGRSKRERWSDDELTVLVAIYLCNDFSIGDDARPENHAMAEALSRSPSAVDRQWRNLEDLRSGKEVLHVGDNVRQALESQLDAPLDGRLRARRVIDANGWGIGWLLR